MQKVSLYSAPEECYLDHISRCKEKFESIFPLFKATASRVLERNNNLEEIFLKMILYHDLGKLIKKWQDNLRNNKSLPSHSPIGAAYLYKTLPQDIKEPLSFAVAIHHTDKGLLGDNIERPDVQAITDGIVEYDGKIIWHDEIKNLPEDYFPKGAGELNIISLKEMAKGLRIWAKGCGLLEQHQRRLQVAIVHHILKLCDISAASERREYERKNDKDYYGGWLMVENIKDYVNAIIKRKV